MIFIWLMTDKITELKELAINEGYDFSDDSYKILAEFYESDSPKTIVENFLSYWWEYPTATQSLKTLIGYLDVPEEPQTLLQIMYFCKLKCYVVDKGEGLLIKHRNCPTHPKVII